MIVYHIFHKNINSTTGFNIDNNKKAPNIRMISEGSCDTDDWK